MNTINTAMIAVISVIVSADLLFSSDFKAFTVSFVHSLVTGVVVLMFSKELRGDSYR